MELFQNKQILWLKISSTFPISTGDSSKVTFLETHLLRADIGTKSVGHCPNYLTSHPPIWAILPTLSSRHDLLRDLVKKMVSKRFGQDFFFFYWPSGGTRNHWQPHTNMDLYFKTRKMYCQFFMGGQKQITGCSLIDVLRLLCSVVVARLPLLRQFVSASPSPFWQDFGNIWSPQPLPNASFCVIVT